MRILFIILLIIPAFLFSQKSDDAVKAEEEIRARAFEKQKAEQQRIESEKQFLEERKVAQQRTELETLLKQAQELDQRKKVHYSQYYEAQKNYQDLIKNRPELYKHLGDTYLDQILFQGKSEKEIELIKQSNAMEAECFALAEKYKSASGNEKKDLENKIEQVVAKLFDVREELKKQEILQLEQRIAELQSTLKERKQNKNEIVSRRVNDLLGKDGLFDWE